MIQNSTPLQRTLVGMALTSSLILASCSGGEGGDATLEQQASIAADNAAGGSGGDPAEANPVSDTGAASAQDAGGGTTRPKSSGFTPPPARSVPGKAPQARPANQPRAGLADDGSPLPEIPTAIQPKIDDAQIAKMRANYEAQGLDAAQIEQKLAAFKAGPQKGPSAPAVPADPNAKLAVDFGKEKHDFGRCRQGDQLTHTFEMRAGGSSPLKIRQVSPTCGCTVGEVKVEGEGGELELYTMGDPIEPGRRITVDATLNTSSKRNVTNVRINCYHNDPVGLTTLQLQANIEPFLTTTPAFLNFGDVKQGETRSQTVDIRTARGELMGLRIDDSRPIPVPDGMTIDLKPLKPDDAGRAAHWQATVSLTEEAAEGNLGYQLLMLTDIEMPPAALKPGQPVPTTPLFHRANASISARVLGALSHNPQFLSMGLVRPGQVVPRTVKIVSHDADFDLSQAKATLRGEQGGELMYGEYLTTSIKPSQGVNGIDVELRLTGLPEEANGSFRGELVVETGHPDKPEVVVRFSGVCRAGVR